MSYFDNIETERYKKPMIISIIFLIFVSLFYHFILNKIFYIVEIEEKIKKYKNDVEKLRIEEKKVKNNYEVLFLEMKNLEAKNKEISTTNKKNFNSKVEFEYFVENELRKNLLQLIVMGRVEKNEGTNYTYFPYVIQGNFLNLVNFLKNIEESNMSISLDKTPFKIEIGKISSFEGKIGVKINKILKKDEKKEKELSIYNLNSKEVSEIKIIEFEYRRYIIIRYLDNTILLLREGEIINIGKDCYTVRVEDSNIFFDKNYDE